MNINLTRPELFFNSNVSRTMNVIVIIIGLARLVKYKYNCEKV